MKGMEYYRLPAGPGWLYVRINRDEYTAELFDAAAHRWVERDAYYGEVVHNGNGEEITEAETLAAIGALQSA